MFSVPVNSHALFFLNILNFCHVKLILRYIYIYISVQASSMAQPQILIKLTVLDSFTGALYYNLIKVFIIFHSGLNQKHWEKMF